MWRNQIGISFPIDFFAFLLHEIVIDHHLYFFSQKGVSREIVRRNKKIKYVQRVLYRSFVRERCENELVY